MVAGAAGRATGVPEPRDAESLGPAPGAVAVGVPEEDAVGVPVGEVLALGAAHGVAWVPAARSSASTTAATPSAR